MTRTAVAIATLLVAGQATTQDITLDSVARSVSLVNAIYNCRQYYPIDTALLERFDRAFNDVGEKVAAKEGENWRAILRAEIERRHNEVVATGLQVWCSYQREIPTNKQFFKRKGRTMTEWLMNTTRRPFCRDYLVAKRRNHAILAHLLRNVEAIRTSGVIAIMHA
jgi:uncharacterized protein YifE (UPF0438 family)